MAGVKGRSGGSRIGAGRRAGHGLIGPWLHGRVFYFKGTKHECACGCVKTPKAPFCRKCKRERVRQEASKRLICGICGRPKSCYTDRCLDCEVTRRREVAARRERIMVPCAECGVSFQQDKHRHGRKARFCSYSCKGKDARRHIVWRRKEFASAHRRALEKVVRQNGYQPCGHCGTWIPKSLKRRMCSQVCQRAADRAFYASRRPVRPMLDCAECGQAFTPTYCTQRFCSGQCSRRCNRRIEKQVRRARKRNLPTDRVDSIEVFSRDGWRCQLCGQRTPRSKRGQMVDCAPELDHVVPLALGGSHTYENTQCSCRACNGAKGARVLGQLRLVG